MAKNTTGNAYLQGDEGDDTLKAYNSAMVTFDGGADFDTCTIADVTVPSFPDPPCEDKIYK